MENTTNKAVLVQDMKAYSENDKLVWQTLFSRQKENLTDKACQKYLDCLNAMGSVLNPYEIPCFKKVNDYFKTTTKWELVVVPGLIPVEDFFILLSQKKFCSSIWLRDMNSLDYLEEPDMFHDVFGHIPLLNNSVFSEFAHEFGKIGVQFIDQPDLLIRLQRLYWFTIEFGVILENKKIKSYGAGILSSFGETNKVAFENPNFITFDLEQVLNKVFDTDVMQEDYFVIASYKELFETILTIKNKYKNELGN